MKTQSIRKQAQQEVLAEIKRLNQPLDEVFMMAPCVGKSSWTVREVIESVENDTPLEGCQGNGSSLIDMHIKYDEYRKKRKK